MGSNKEYDYLMKMLMIGESGTGKSAILLRFAENDFSADHLCTIGVDFKIRSVEMEGKVAKLQIWDTAGQERFKTITTSYYHGAQGVFVCFDVTNRASFERVPYWLEEVKKHAKEHVKVILVGNKIDLRHYREVSEQEARTFAESRGVKYLETSAKEDTNVVEAFDAMARKLRQQYLIDVDGSKRQKQQHKNLKGTSLSLQQDNKGHSSPTTNQHRWSTCAC